MRTSVAFTRATKRQVPTLLVAAFLLLCYLIFAAVCEDCFSDDRQGHQIEMNRR